jgi:hypothetical protein
MNISKYDCVQRLIGVLFNQYIYIMPVYVFSDMKMCFIGATYVIHKRKILFMKNEKYYTKATRLSSL